MTFQYISEGNDMQLTQSQEDLLSAIEGANCKLNGFTSILDLRLTKRYKVVISDSASLRETLNNELKAYDLYYEDSVWKQESNRFSNQWSLMDECLSRIIGEKKEKIGNILKRLSSNTLLGLYSSHDYSYDSPVIYLLKENIEAYADREGISRDNVFGFVYVHEAMHAYYNSLNIEGYHSVTELEEAFAECGMIEFLKQADSALPPQLAQDARNFVLQKQFNGPYDYGFGLAMADISANLGKTVDIMSRYREISNWLECAYFYEEAVRKLVRKSQLDRNYDNSAKDCYKLVEEILDRDYKKPEIDFNELPGIEDYMRKAGVTLKPGAASPVIPVPSTSIDPASKLYLPNSGAQPSELVELFASASLEDIAQAIFKSQKGEPETMVLLGRMGIKAKLKADPSLANINTLLRALQFWCDITLAILDTDGHYVLYGPEALAEEFKPAPPKPTAKTTSTAPRVRTKYDLTDLQGNVFKNLPMVRLAVEGIKSYAKQYPSTIAELQKKFPQELRGHWKSKGAETVMSASSIPANDRDYKSDMEDLIPTTDGPAMINRNWDRNNIGSLISIFEKSGMKITPSSI